MTLFDPKSSLTAYLQGSQLGVSQFDQAADIARQAEILDRQRRELEGLRAVVKARIADSFRPISIPGVPESGAAMGGMPGTPGGYGPPAPGSPEAAAMQGDVPLGPPRPDAMGGIQASGTGLPGAGGGMPGLDDEEDRMVARDLMAIADKAGGEGLLELIRFTGDRRKQRLMHRRMQAIRESGLRKQIQDTRYRSLADAADAVDDPDQWLRIVSMDVDDQLARERLAAQEARADESLQLQRDRMAWQQGEEGRAQALAPKKAAAMRIAHPQMQPTDADRAMFPGGVAEATIFLRDHDVPIGVGDASLTGRSAAVPLGSLISARETVKSQYDMAPALKASLLRHIDAQLAAAAGQDASVANATAAPGGARKLDESSASEIAVSELWKELGRRPTEDEVVERMRRLLRP